MYKIACVVACVLYAMIYYSHIIKDRQDPSACQLSVGSFPVRSCARLSQMNQLDNKIYQYCIC